MGEMSSCSGLRRLSRTICRKKIVEYDLSSTPLDRCLTTSDLSFIAIGCMMGSGVYVLTGEIAGGMAGPGGTVSFIISGLVALLAALCYMECATRIPETGASYIYAYVAFGEVCAFMVGWNAVILRVMSVAMVSRGWSAYFDNILKNAVGNWTVDVVLDGTPWESPLLADYPDFLAAAIALLTSVLVAVGTSVSAKANGFFVSINIVTVLLVLVVGLMHADFKNLTTPYGYFPYGLNGVFTGAAACFTGYCGFEAVAFSAEEAKNPNRGLPIGVIVGFLVSMLCYSGVLLSLTAMVPYYEINVQSPFVSAFAAVGVHWMQYFVAIGALCSMTGCIINCVYCVARSIYALARDGLLPQFLGYTHPRSQTPVTSTLFGGALSIIITIFIDFVSLIQFISLVAFVEFIIVISSCIKLRYCPPQEVNGNSSINGGYPKVTEVVRNPNGSIQNGGLSNMRNGHRHSESTPLLVGNRKPLMTNTYHKNKLRRATASHPGRTVVVCLVSFIALSSVVMVLLTNCFHQISSGSLPHVFSLVLLSLLAIVSAIPLTSLHQYNDGAHFMVPMMPFFPLVSILANIFLMVQFDALAFIELAAWTAIGLVVYFCYGIRHSHESDANKHRSTRYADAHHQPMTNHDEGETIPITRDLEASCRRSRRRSSSISSDDDGAYWAGDSLVTSSETSFGRGFV